MRFGLTCRAAGRAVRGSGRLDAGGRRSDCPETRSGPGLPPARARVSRQEQDRLAREDLHEFALRGDEDQGRLRSGGIAESNPEIGLGKAASSDGIVAGSAPRIVEEGEHGPLDHARGVHALGRDPVRRESRSIDGAGGRAGLRGVLRVGRNEPPHRRLPCVPNARAEEGVRSFKQMNADPPVPFLAGLRTRRDTGSRTTTLGQGPGSARWPRTSPAGRASGARSPRSPPNRAAELRRRTTSRRSHRLRHGPER